MSSKKILPCGALVVGLMIILIGMSFAILYVLEAIIFRIGEPDQSLIFWYLPILFIGLIALIVGVGIGLWGMVILRKIQKQDSASKN